jgi:UDP-glucuronate 4-epimerase
MRFLITGSAGFIGFHLAKRLLDEGHEIVGIDGFTPYYDVELKERRHAQLVEQNRYQGHRGMIEDRTVLTQAWKGPAFDVVIHLAAQAGVRYSIENPRAYIDSNLVATFNILEMCRNHRVPHLLLASTSSVYGARPSGASLETDRADHPLTLYAATKKSTEQMAHSYSHLWNIPTTAFRFFTVYGPWGRPDMALFKFTQGIIAGAPIDIYNHGRMERDFTYIDDLTEAVSRLVNCVPGQEDRPVEGDSLSPTAPFRVVNIGAGAPVNLLRFVEIIEKCLGRQAVRNYMDMQPGDVPRTFANTDLLHRLTGFRPVTSVETGVRAFVEWYQRYFQTEPQFRPTQANT